MEDFGEASIDSKFFLEDSHEQVNTHGNPDLCPDGVGRVSIKGFDAKMLFDPLEEPFDPPTATVKFRDGECWQREVVRQEDEPFVAFGVEVMHSPQLAGVPYRCFDTGQDDRLIAAQPGLFVDRMRLQTTVVEVAFAKRCPRKERQAQVDGRRIERVGRVGQLESQRLVDIQIASMPDQHLGKVGVDTPIAKAIGIRESAASNVSTKTQVIQFRRDRTQTSFDIAQTFALGKLSEGHRQKLIATRETTDPMVPAITPHGFVEFVTRKEVHDLCKHPLAAVHRSAPDKPKGDPGGRVSGQSSSRARS